MTEPVRIQKYLANLGIASRREVERWIKEGRLSLNHEPVRPGQAVSDKDRLFLDGKPLRMPRPTANPLPHRIIALNKPEGVICTRKDPERRPTIFDLLPRVQSQRWISVGRLDINTSGLLLLTTDGELANRLMHPSYSLPRDYLVRVFGKVEDQHLQAMLDGVELEDGPAAFDAITPLAGEGINRWFQVTLHSGRNRIVRRLWASQGLNVNRLKRSRFGPLLLPKSLRQKRWAEIEGDDLQGLYQSAGLTLPTSNQSSRPSFRPTKHRR